MVPVAVITKETALGPGGLSVKRGEGMITETFILTELFYPIRVEKFRCNRKFRDHVRTAAATVTGLTTLPSVA